MKKWISLFALTVCIPCSMWADKSSFSDVIDPPWLTGPLLAPSAFAIPVGHYYVEPYLFATANTGSYSKNGEVVEKPTFWKNESQTLIQFGLTEWMDFQINPTLYYNYTEGIGSWALGDMPVGLDIMFFRRGNDPRDWITSIKIEFLETLPLGKYRNLHPKKKGTDGGGEGSWVSSLVLVWGQLVHLKGRHFFASRIALSYNLPAPVAVKGFNAFGGGFGTHGTVYPAQSFQVDIGLELTLNRNWVLALDVVGNGSGRVRFKGNPGTGKNGLPAVIGGGSSLQFSLAPAIEYNWSRNIGIIAGSWVSIGGRNSLQFFSGVFAFSYYI